MAEYPFLGTFQEVPPLINRPAPVSTPPATHQPRRGDAVDAWIRHERDQHDFHGHEWYALDDLLDVYRLHADTGTPLDQHAIEERS